jgi:prolipoprotein diacylglyceryl transferase
VIPAAVVASIPSPSEGVWYLGPIPIRAYAITILLGIVVAIWVGERRWVARGGRSGEVTDVAIWAVPFGIVGARAYHVLTDWDRYFGEGRDPFDAVRLWGGGTAGWAGLSVIGAIAGGVLGGYIAARRKGIPLPALADALAPGIVLAQAIGRWGNYFNQELFGRPTDLPWGLEIDQRHRPAGYAEFETFHPTFLYESLWAVTIAVVLVWADRRFRMGHGRVFALYVALYTAGRTLMETLRIDTGGPVEGPAREILGLRINAWVSILLFVAAIGYLVVSARLRPGREIIVRPAEDEPAVEPAVDSDEPAGRESETVEGDTEPAPGRTQAATGESEPAAKTSQAASDDAEPAGPPTESRDR